LHGLAHLPHLQLRNRSLELGYGVPGVYPPQISAPRCRAVVRIQARELGKVDPVHDPLAQPEEFPFRLALGNEVISASEDVAHVSLLAHQGGSGAANLQQLDHVKPCRAAEHAAHSSWLQLAEILHEQLREPLLAAPSHGATLESVRSV